MQSNGVTHDYTEQRAAVEAMLRSTDQVFALRGVAGAGKTTALKEFHAGVDAAGKSHVLLAPTTKAVEALKREIPEGQVQTVEAFLLASQKGAQLQDAVITVDEWGLLSNRSGHELLRIAKEHGALVRFVGDTRQHVAVEAGDFGRTLEQHSNLRSVSISKISRQRDPEYRAAVMEMASSKVTEGLARLDQKGWIHEEKSGYLIEAARRYLELSGCGKKLVTERGEPHVLAVGPTHAEIRAFTVDVRAGHACDRRAFRPCDQTASVYRARYDARYAARFEYVHAWHGCNPGLGKDKGAWSFRSGSLHGQTEPDAVCAKKRKTLSHWLMRTEKNTKSTSALTERSLSWERSEKLNCKLVTGSGSGRTLLASLMALWRVLRARMNKGGW